MQNESLDKFATLFGDKKKEKDKDSEDFDLASLLLGLDDEDTQATKKSKTPPGYDALAQYSNLGKKGRGSLLNQLIMSAIMRPVLQLMQQNQDPQQMLQSLLAGKPMNPQGMLQQGQPQQMAQPQMQPQQPQQMPQQPQPQQVQQPQQQPQNPLVFGR